ncbi:uncharacterized protein UBRO_20662 [Ustilago bromivora]|uniref:Uncharacterized protein n=1 Tax=Ustilago bromivora TaxID=307758 RepID=A0A1K0GQJ0_9BASI|nr:uncharacterized protein UBRO_20662 [Ustilago bromivora]
MCVVNQSSSTPATCSHQSSFSSAAETIHAGPTFAPAASVITLGARVDSINSHIGRLEDTIHLNFATILTRIDSLQSSPHPPSTPTSLATVTSQPPLPETPTQADLVFADSQVRITKESSEQHLDLNDTLLAYLEILIKFDQIYLWKGVTEYHLAICHQHFGMGVTHKWAHTNITLHGQTLLTNFQTPAAPSSSAPSSKPGAKSSLPGRTTTNPPPVKICMRFNSNWGCSGVTDLHMHYVPADRLLC